MKYVKIAQTNEVKEGSKKKITYDNKIQLYPMSVIDVSDLINTLLSISAIGVVHVRGVDRTTMYNIALQITSIYHITINHVESSLNEIKEPVHIKLLGIVLPTRVRQMLIEFLEIKNEKDKV